MKTINDLSEMFEDFLDKDFNSGGNSPPMPLALMAYKPNAVVGIMQSYIQNSPVSGVNGLVVSCVNNDNEPIPFDESLMNFRVKAYNPSIKVEYVILDLGRLLSAAALVPEQTFKVLFCIVYMKLNNIKTLEGFNNSTIELVEFDDNAN